MAKLIVLFKELLYLQIFSLKLIILYLRQPHYQVMEIKHIATFRSPFCSKFGIPKQSGLVEELEGEIVFESAFRNPDYIRGIEGFDFLWLIWEFSANRHKANSPVVRPPVLGGNEKRGVFATRSPFRPNNIGLSSVRLKSVDWDNSSGPILHVTGADLMNGTPIFDIKPYVTYSDSHADAQSGFTNINLINKLTVVIPEAVAVLFSKQQLTALRKTLELDPRPHYHDNPDKIYGMPFLIYDIRFRVAEGTCYVLEAERLLL